MASGVASVSHVCLRGEPSLLMETSLPHAQQADLMAASCCAVRERRAWALWCLLAWLRTWEARGEVNVQSPPKGQGMVARAGVGCILGA